jgi:predicted ArsR family transcriptional regulator
VSGPLFHQQIRLIDSRTMSDADQHHHDIAAVALLADPVRRAVYEWTVAQRRPVGRVETAQALGLKPSLATFHLDRLADGGLLAATYRRINERRGPGAGRPARVYWRAERAVVVSLPERRYELAAGMLAQALERDPDRAGGAARDASRLTGHRIGIEARRRAPRRAPAALLLLQGLDELGYEPVTERKDGTIRLRNCPFDALVPEHRSLVCGMNLAMLEGLAEAIGPRWRVRPVIDAQPGFCCVELRTSTG